MTEKCKYYCEQCEFGAHYKSSFDKHCETVLHKTGKRKGRSDKKADIYKCDKCEYKSKNEYNCKLHVLNKHGTKDERDKNFKYYCKDCDFGVFIEQLYKLHCNTLKHKRRMGEI